MAGMGTREVLSITSSAILCIALTLECVPCVGDGCSGTFPMFGLPSALAALADGAERASEMVFEAGLATEQRVRVPSTVS